MLFIQLQRVMHRKSLSADRSTGLYIAPSRGKIYWHTLENYIETHELAYPLRSGICEKERLKKWQSNAKLQERPYWVDSSVYTQPRSTISKRFTQKSKTHGIHTERSTNNNKFATTLSSLAVRSLSLLIREVLMSSNPLPSPPILSC